MSVSKPGQPTGGYQQQQTGVRSRTPEPLCPYSFVPISQSLTPNLSERTRTALVAHQFLVSQYKFEPREKALLGKEFDAKRAFQERRAGGTYAAIKVLQGAYAGFPEINVSESENQRAQRGNHGLIVGDMAADPRFATRDMWHTGEINENDRAKMFWRMAYVAQRGEASLVGLAGIQIADCRTMEELQQMWQPVDALMPVLSASKGQPASSVAARPSQPPSASTAPRARVKEQNDAYEVEYQPASQPFAAGTAVASAILGILVTLALGYFAFGDKLLASPPAPHAPPFDAGGSGDRDSVAETKADTGTLADASQPPGDMAGRNVGGPGATIAEPISIYFAIKADVKIIAERLEPPENTKPTRASETDADKSERDKKDKENTAAYNIAKSKIATIGFPDDAIGKILFALTMTDTAIRRSSDPKAYFDPRTNSVSVGDDGKSPPDWSTTGVFVFDFNDCGKIPQPALPDFQFKAFPKTATSSAFCAYGPKFLLDQLKIPE